MSMTGVGSLNQKNQHSTTPTTHSPTVTACSTFYCILG